MENLNSVSARVRRTQHGLLLQRFLEVTARLHAAQSHYRQRCLQRVRRHLHITGNSAVTDEELEEMLENGQSEVFVSNVLGAARATRAALDEVTSRHRELQRLERAMRELQELFAALGAAVEGQVSVPATTDVTSISTDITSCCCSRHFLPLLLSLPVAIDVTSCCY